MIGAVNSEVKNRVINLSSHLNGNKMDEEPFIIAGWMAEEERRRLEKKAANEKMPLLDNTYQQSRYDQPAGSSRIGWIVVAIVIIIIYLIFRN